MLLRTIAGLSMLLSGLNYVLSGLALWLLPVLYIGWYLALLLLAFLFLWALSAVVDMEKPQENDSKLYRRIVMLYIEALIPLVGLKNSCTSCSVSLSTGKMTGKR